eukprot:scaffold12357_cov91-Skeletonema_dohrnii-CCMP3373.AAC.3
MQKRLDLMTCILNRVFAVTFTVSSSSGLNTEHKHFFTIFICVLRRFSDSLYLVVTCHVVLVRELLLRNFGEALSERFYDIKQAHETLNSGVRNKVVNGSQHSWYASLGGRVIWVPLFLCYQWKWKGLVQIRHSRVCGWD